MPAETAAANARQPRRSWDAYQGDKLLGTVGADSSGRAIAKAAGEFKLHPSTIRVVSKRSGKEPKALDAPIADSLSAAEAVRLAERESVIDAGLETAVRVWQALSEIRDERLYRATHATFEDYCQARYGWGRNYANKQIRAAEVCAFLGTAVPKNGAPEMPLPPTERHARPLAQLPPAQQAEAWSKAVETAPDGRPTAAHVKAVVDEIRGKPPRKASPDTPAGETLVNGVPGRDRRVDAMRRKGLIPEGVAVEVTDPGDEATSGELAVEEARERLAIQEAEQSDEEWLATLPIVRDRKLSGQLLEAFKWDALYYRALMPALKHLRDTSNVAKRTIRKPTRLECFYEFTVAMFLRRQQPKDWKVCPPPTEGGCGGTGSLLTGQCGRCHGRGYLGQ